MWAGRSRSAGPLVFYSRYQCGGRQSGACGAVSEGVGRVVWWVYRRRVIRGGQCRRGASPGVRGLLRRCCVSVVVCRAVVLYSSVAVGGLSLSVL